MSSALAKYDDVGMQIITCGSRAEMLRLECYLRPTGQIGWNTASGGGDPPNSSDYWKGRVRTQEHRTNLSRALVGRKVSEETRGLLSIAGSKHRNPQWTGIYYIDGVFFITKEDAAKHTNVSHSTVTYRCKKMKKVRVDGSQSLVKNQKDNFPTWKFIAKEQIILIA